MVSLAYNIGDKGGVGETLKPLPEGEYEASVLREPYEASRVAMTRDGVGFALELKPQFKTKRTLLRIHPDGNVEGTAGCIGITENATKLKSFQNKLNNYLKKYKSIRLKVKY